MCGCWAEEKNNTNFCNLNGSYSNRMHNNSDWQFIFLKNQYQFISLIKHRFFTCSVHCQFSFNFAKTLIQNHGSTAPVVLYKIFIWDQEGEYPIRGMKPFFCKVVNFIFGNHILGCSSGPTSGNISNASGTISNINSNFYGTLDIRIRDKKVKMEFHACDGCQKGERLRW